MFTGYFTTTGLELEELLAISDAGETIEVQLLQLEAEYDSLQKAFDKADGYDAMFYFAEQLDAIEAEYAYLDEWLTVLEAEFAAIDAQLQYDF